MKRSVVSKFGTACLHQPVGAFLLHALFVCPLPQIMALLLPMRRVCSGEERLHTPAGVPAVRLHCCPALPCQQLQNLVLA